MKMSGKPDAGNLHVRFDEGDQMRVWSLLYRLSGISGPPDPEGPPIPEFPEKPNIGTDTPN
jgi:hypothetical protein